MANLKQIIRVSLEARAAAAGGPARPAGLLAMEPVPHDEAELEDTTWQPCPGACP